MEQFTLICTACRQEMLVPASAIGRRGLCPGCGTEVEIVRDTLVPYPPPRPRRGGGLSSSGLLHQKAAEKAQGERDDAARRFAEAVDLYNQRQYAQALAILDALRQAYPNSDEVETARQQCLQALRERATLSRTYDQQSVDEHRLTPELVKSVVLDKLLHSPSEEVQLQAAELAAKLLGMTTPTTPAAPAAAPAAAASPMAYPIVPFVAAPHRVETANGNGHAPAPPKARRARKPKSDKPKPEKPRKRKI